MSGEKVVLAKLEEFQKSVDLQFELVRKDISTLYKKDENKSRFQWKLTGILIAVVGFISIIGEGIVIFLKLQ